MTGGVYGAEVTEQSEQTKPARPRWVLAAAIAVALVIAGGTAYWLTRGASTLQVAGKVSIAFEGAEFGGAWCKGKPRYQDVSLGAPVVISDSTGATVALSKLEHGVVADGRCDFAFVTVDAPAGKGFYGIKVAERNVVQFSEDRIAAGPVTLVLG